jgi:cytochrome c553
MQVTDRNSGVHIWINRPFAALFLFEDLITQLGKRKFSFACKFSLCSFFSAGKMRIFARPMPMNMRAILKFPPYRVALWSLLLLICGLNVSGCQQGAANAATRGKELFETCAPCHGEDGAGNPSVGAPNIAGMNDWYVQGELEKFRSGARGEEFNDMEGMRMRPMALSLAADEDVKTVAHYAASLPGVRHAASLPGDPKAGEALFGTCKTCHGPSGAGLQALKAPRLAGVDDWYLATEIRKFRSGVRGANPKDHEGNLMRPMARSLANEDAIRNVVAYIGTLKP